MKKFISISLLALTFCSFGSYAEEKFYDVFMGMLETNDKNELVFVKCGHKSSPMKFVSAEGADLDSINKAKKTLEENKDKPVYVRTSANAEFLADDPDYSYIIYVKSVDEITVGKSCHLTDLF